MADEALGTGTLSKHIPKDYPVSPDIEDHRHDTPVPKGMEPMPEIVLKSQPGDYQAARKARKK